jgi:hypothetical protein
MIDMRKAFLSLAAAVMVFGVPALAVSPASAAGPVLGCNIQPSGTTDFTAGICVTQRAATSFTVDYLAQSVTGTATYIWTPPAGTIVAGCTSTNPDCELTVHHGTADQDLIATVVVTQSGSSTTLSAEAFIPAACGHMLC